MNEPLKGIKVVDLSAHGAGPAAGKILADWGAEVIKIEPLKGEAGRTTGAAFGMRADEMQNPHLELKDSNKISLTLNLKSAEGKEVILKLIEKANIFISNYRYKALERLGLDYETVSKNYPHIIYGHLSGFGSKGKDADDPGFDTVAYWSRSGALIDFCEKDSPPLTPPFGLGDFTTACSLAGGCAACLDRQSKTGEGEKVMISLLGQSIWNESMLIQTIAHGDTFPKSRKTPTNPLRNTYQCSDGEWIMISVLEYERYYSQVCRLLGHEELIDNSKYNTEDAVRENTSALIDIFDKAFTKKDSHQWLKEFGDADIASSRISHIKDVYTDEQVLANDFIYKYKNRDGSEDYSVTSPVRFGKTDAPKHNNAPLLGEHSKEILSRLGYSEDQISEMTAKGVTSIR